MLDVVSLLRKMLLVTTLIGTCFGWPSRFSDCRTFPTLGQPQWRRVPHPPIEIMCTPVPPTTFDYCMANCAGNALLGQNCSKKMCVCEERCMADSLTCSKHPMQPYNSTADALSAKHGESTFLFNGKLPLAYTAGSVNRITIVPAGSDVDRRMTPSLRSSDLQRPNATSTFFLLDAGVGSFSEVKGGGAHAWQVQCDGTRAAFNSIQDNPVELDWLAPSNGHVPILFRLAAATSMGNITLNAAVLNSTAPPLPSNEDAYACSISESSTRQCVRVPYGTPGAFAKDDCAAACLTLRCTKCQHVYFPMEDGKGVHFEDLPNDWRCPMCGAPKSAYIKQVAYDGSTQWVHI